MTQSLKGLALALQSKGRFGDSQLVHLNPIEVNALASLSPTGKLTTNPDTGLPEAFLPLLLPLLGGIGGSLLGASSIGAGLGLTAALGGAIGSGLGSFAATGDVGKGIMSGIMGYGLGSAAGLLGGAGGAAGASAAAVQNAATAAAAAPQVASASVEGLIGANAMPAVAGDLVTPAGVSAMNAGHALNVAKPTDGIFGNYDLSLPSLKSTFIDNAGKTTLPIGMGLAGLMGDMGGSGSGQGAGPPSQQSSNINTNVRTGRRYLGPGTADPQGYERRYFGYQSGGKVDPKKGAALNAPGYSMDNPVRRKQLYDDAEWRRNETKSAPVITEEEASGYLGKYNEGLRGRQLDSTTRDRYDAPSEMRFAGGGGVSGPGSGLDDAIPAIVNGRQPAALSDGEYVVPAHAVSALGNGSTSHGVRQLDGMVDNVMTKKYGTKNRKPRPINPVMMLPGGQGARPFASGGMVRLMNGQATMDDYLQAYAMLGSGKSRRTPMPIYEQPERQTMEMGPDEQPEREYATDDSPDLATARERISKLESGGNYGALGPMVGKDRAYGRYQVMGANVPSWSKEALGREMSPEEFLADNKAQDAVFNHRFGGYMKKYGGAGASRAWFAGEGGMNNRGAKDALGTSVADYERRYSGG